MKLKKERDSIAKISLSQRSGEVAPRTKMQERLLSAPFLDQRFDRSPKIDEAVGGLYQQLIKDFGGIKQRTPPKTGRNSRAKG